MFEALRRLLTGRARPSPDGSRPTGRIGRLAFWRRAPRPIPAHLMWGGQKVQLPSDGYGPLFHRRYSIEIDAPGLSPEVLMSQVKGDVHDFSPTLLADFAKRNGEPGLMRPGDEYDISILGPWNGSVRVIEVTPTSFTFVTLEGHPEAGQITFSAEPHPVDKEAMVFEICSWARSRDMIVGLSYDTGKVGQEVQKSAWVTFCERVAEASGGTPRGEVEVTTEKREFQGEVVPVA